MEFECVCSVAMCDLRLQVCWQVDDSDGFKRTSGMTGLVKSEEFAVIGDLLLYTDTASDTQKF